MIAVLIGSRTVGSSSWAAVRNRKTIVVEGMGDADLIRVFFRYKESNEVTHQDIWNNGEFSLPEGCDRVRVDHIETSGSYVFVDLK